MRIGLMWMLVACSVHGEAELVDSCDSDEECLPCANDDECVIAHNPCTETAVCGHVDEEIAVVSLGCSEGWEYGTPEPERCLCEDVCSAQEK